MEPMDRERNFWVVGGDMRQRALAELLREDGHTVHTAALEGEGLTPEPLGPGLALAHCVILPLPVLRREGILHTPMYREEVPLGAVLDHMGKGQLLCGGIVTPEVQEAAQSRGLRAEDYYAREECTVANAVATAEGAVQLALERLPFTLHKARVMVLGFGRVGKLTAHRMAALGARVTVAARSYEHLAWAEAYGYETVRLSTLTCELGGADLIVNTIPYPVLGREKLRWISRHTLLMEVASEPGGFDRQAAEELGLNLLDAPGLPGKTAPVTAAAIIRDAVYHILWETEE